MIVCERYISILSSLFWYCLHTKTTATTLISNNANNKEHYSFCLKSKKSPARHHHIFHSVRVEHMTCQSRLLNTEISTSAQLKSSNYPPSRRCSVQYFHWQQIAECTEQKRTMVWRRFTCATWPCLCVCSLSVLTSKILQTAAVHFTTADAQERQASVSLPHIFIAEGHERTVIVPWYCVAPLLKRHGSQHRTRHNFTCITVHTCNWAIKYTHNEANVTLA